jgi:hypothetical protein
VHERDALEYSRSRWRNPDASDAAEGIERLWKVSSPLLETPPPVRLYEGGSWGPKSIHHLVAPHAWRRPFERAWVDPNEMGSEPAFVTGELGEAIRALRMDLRCLPRQGAGEGQGTFDRPGRSSGSHSAVTGADRPRAGDPDD